MTLSETAASGLSIRLFGPFDPRVDGQPLPRLRSRKVAWLLTLLTLRQGQQVHRDWLMDTLWPDSLEIQASSNLRQCLVNLRRVLGNEAGRLKTPTHRTLLLDLSGAFADVLAFDEAIHRKDLSSLEEAIALYRGPLLEGCQEEWIWQEREVRAQSYIAALETVAA